MTERTIPFIIIGERPWKAFRKGFQERLDRFEFFRVEHAISPEVWEGRPYVPYTTTDLEPVREAFQNFAFNQQKWAENTATKCDGFIMIQHAVPGLGLLDIPPQLRPYEAIYKGTIWHYHPSIDPPAGYIPVKPNGQPLSGKRCSKAWAKRLHILRHVDHDGAQVAKRLGYDTPAKLRELLTDPANESDLRQVLREANNEEVHPHQEFAKYLLTIRPEIPRHRPGRPIYDDDPRTSPGKRNDLHPLARERLASAELVYFCIEGKIKADAILSEIIRLDLPQSVCSVPSIGQWDAYELDAFARRDLAGKMVAIVYDADGGDNPQVMTQALLLRGRLREPTLGVRAAAIFAPPYANYKRNSDFKGGDDHLGIAGGLLDDLEMLGRKVPARPLVEWAIKCQQTVVNGRHLRCDGVARNLKTLMGLSLLFGPDGQGQPSLRRISRFTGVSDTGVKNAVRFLIKLGAVDTDKPLDTARWQWRSNTYRSPDLELVDRPTIRIIDPNLRAIELPTERLEDWIERQTLSGPWEGDEESMTEPVTLEERVGNIEEALAQLASAIAPKKQPAMVTIEAAAAQLEQAIDAWNGEQA